MRAILTYHSIDDSGSPISMPLDVFERHVRWLASGVVRVTSLEELDTAPADRDAIAITFDDGFENVAQLAAPLLGRHGLPAALFVVTGHVGGDNTWGGRAAPGIPVMPLLGWSALSRLAADGWTLGAHTRTHSDLTTRHSADVREEIEGSLHDIEAHTGVRPRCFAYPYGRVNDAVADVASSLCERAYTTSMRAFRADECRSRLPRLDAYYFRTGGWLERWGQPDWQAYVTSRALARRVRAMMTP
jgi:peptidoglycan/xylan/chitin deacetylase (PgdA/CDA1 family)